MRKSTNCLDKYRIESFRRSSKVIFEVFAFYVFHQNVTCIVFRIQKVVEHANNIWMIYEIEYFDFLDEICKKLYFVLFNER